MCLIKNGYFSILVRRTSPNDIRIEIEGDFVGSSRKSRLFVNESLVSKNIDALWKSIKTTKKLGLYVQFDHIDLYDNCDSYNVPNFTIGKMFKSRKTKINYSSTNSIPKDWSVIYGFEIQNTKTKTPIIEIVKKVLGSKFTKDIEKQFTKNIKQVLTGDKNYTIYTNENY